MTIPSNTVWRFIDTGLLSGVENMAIDEALLACFEPGKSLPILRTYGWNPPAFSCGRFQKPAEIIALDRCRADGTQVVKRITGGGVIYHGSELTYSLVCPTDFIPDARSVKDAFFRLTEFLITFYRKLGLPACYAVEHYPLTKKLGERTPLCFAGIESCDILINGLKIGGNAQKRLKNVIFQHGSIPLQPITARGNTYLLEPDTDIAATTTSLEEQGVEHERGFLTNLLKDSFAESFGVVLSPAGVTPVEAAAVAGYMQKFE